MLRFKFCTERGSTSAVEPVCRFEVWAEIKWSVNLRGSCHEAFTL